MFGNVAGSLTKGGGLLGTLFGGFLANGGSAQAGKSYVVGEKGQKYLLQLLQAQLLQIMLLVVLLM